MPTSRSFPSGHSAAAFAFATGVGHVSPAAAVPLRALAALVAYSRVHTGVHYPGDVLAGSLIGTTVGQLTTHIHVGIVAGATRGRSSTRWDEVRTVGAVRISCHWVDDVPGGARLIWRALHVQAKGAVR